MVRWRNTSELWGMPIKSMSLSKKATPPVPKSEVLPRSPPISNQELHLWMKMHWTMVWTVLTNRGDASWYVYSSLVFAIDYQDWHKFHFFSFSRGKKHWPVTTVVVEVVVEVVEVVKWRSQIPNTRSVYRICCDGRHIEINTIRIWRMHATIGWGKIVKEIEDEEDWPTATIPILSTWACNHDQVCLLCILMSKLTSYYWVFYWQIVYYSNIQMRSVWHATMHCWVYTDLCIFVMFL